MRLRVATLESTKGSVYKGRYKVATIENLLVYVDHELEEVISKPPGEQPVRSYYDSVWEWVGEMNVVEVGNLKMSDTDVRVRFEAEYDGKNTVFSGKVIIVNRTDEGRLQFVGDETLNGFKVW